MIPLFKVYSNKVEALRRMGRCMDRGYTGQGPVVEEFEAALAAHYKMDPERVVTVNSGTSAIMLALLSAGVKPGDRVICSPVTCMADAHAIRAIGGEIVWADCNPRTGLTEHKNIAAVETGLEVSLITDISGTTPPRKQSLLFNRGVVEDAAQNFSGDFWGDFAALSFQSIKHLSTGDGGAVLFGPHIDPETVKEARLIRWFGLDRKTSFDFRCQQNIKVAGYKWHMTDLAASLGIANLKGAIQHVADSIENAYWYQKHLPDQVLTGDWDEEGTYWTYMILVGKRDAFLDFMKENGVYSSPVQSIGTRHDLFPKVSLPGAEWYSAHNAAIPNGWWVTKKDRQKIANLVTKWVKS